MSKPTIASLQRENCRLRERLEMTHVWQFVNGKMVRRRVARGHFLTGPAIYDGIDCRNETIRQQDRYIAELKLRLAAFQEFLKTLKVNRQPAPKRRPYNDTGFDPRDGSSGKPERQYIPKHQRVKIVTGPARIKSKKPSSWPPSARPPKGSP